MKLKILAVMAMLTLAGCGDDATVGTLSAVRCNEAACKVVLSTRDLANSPQFTEYTSCDRDVEKLLARKVIMINKPGACVAIYDYYQ